MSSAGTPSKGLGGGDRARVELYWLPLGAGDTSGCVRWNGRIFEALVARHERREPRDLYHSALEVHLGTDRFVIEMTPVWGNEHADRGVASGGAVGLPWLGHSRAFRYEGPPVAQRQHPGRVRSRGQPTTHER